MNGAAPTGPTLHNLFGNPIYAGIYAYGVRATDRRRQKPGRPGTGRRPPRAGEAEVFLPDRVPAYITREQFDRNQAQLRANRADHLGPVRAGTCAAVGLAGVRPVRIAHDGGLQQ